MATSQSPLQVLRFSIPTFIPSLEQGKQLEKAEFQPKSTSSLCKKSKSPRGQTRERAGNMRAWVTMPTATAQEKHRWGAGEERCRRMAGERDTISFACYIFKCTSVRLIFYNQTPVQTFNFAIRNFQWPMPIEVPGTYWVLPECIFVSVWLEANCWGGEDSQGQQVKDSVDASASWHWEDEKTLLEL